MERQQMRSIHYSLRICIVVICVQLCYWAAGTAIHRSWDLLIAGLLLVITIGIERLWAFLGWMGPVVGTVDKKLQARILQETMEREFARTWRYGSASTVVAMSQKRRTSLHIVARHLRTSDAIFRGDHDYIFAILPETSAEQAQIAVERIIAALPIAHALCIDSDGLRAAAKTLPGETSASLSPRELARLCLQELTQGLFRAASEPHYAKEQFSILDLSARHTTVEQTRVEQTQIQADYSFEQPVALTN